MDSQNLDFSDIAPYSAEEFDHYLDIMLQDPGFEHAVRWIWPDLNFQAFAANLKTCHNKMEFHNRVLAKFLAELEQKTTSGITVNGIENVDPEKRYTFISNHRDIVLDASFLNLTFLRNNRLSCEVAIGDNLLILDWIKHLVKLNGSFLVKRNLPTRQALDAAKQLSGYMHYAITQKHESVWIAQRQGRAKDSSDQTQESVIKMLALGGKGSTAESLAELNIFPVAISYEYDPNDFLKAREYLLRHRDPDFKKSPKDDLIAMELGMLDFKGRVHVSFANCITPWLEICQDLDKQEVIRQTCHRIDTGIHTGYKIYPINYVAFDRAFDSDMYADRYSEEEAKEVETYIEGQLDKVDLPDITKQERSFMRTYMYMMYANPLRNKLLAAGFC